MKSIRTRPKINAESTPTVYDESMQKQCQNDNSAAFGGASPIFRFGVVFNNFLIVFDHFGIAFDHFLILFGSVWRLFSAPQAGGLI